MNHLQPWARRLTVRLTQLTIIVAFVVLDFATARSGVIGLAGLLLALLVGYIAGRMGLTKSDPAAPKPYVPPLRELPQPLWQLLLYGGIQLACLVAVIVIHAEASNRGEKVPLGAGLIIATGVAFALTVIVMGVIEGGRWILRRIAYRHPSSGPAPAGRDVSVKARSDLRPTSRAA